MERKRHSPEETIKKLREAAALIAGGRTAQDAARQIGVSMQTYHRWKAEYSGSVRQVSHIYFSSVLLLRWGFNK